MDAGGEALLLLWRLLSVAGKHLLARGVTAGGSTPPPRLRESYALQLLGERSWGGREVGRNGVTLPLAGRRLVAGPLLGGMEGSGGALLVVFGLPKPDGGLHLRLSSVNGQLVPSGSTGDAGSPNSGGATTGAGTSARRLLLAAGTGRLINPLINAVDRHPITPNHLHKLLTPNFLGDLRGRGGQGKVGGISASRAGVLNTPCFIGRIKDKGHDGLVSSGSIRPCLHALGSAPSEEGVETSGGACRGRSLAFGVQGGFPLPGGSGAAHRTDDRATSVAKLVGVVKEGGPHRDHRVAEPLERVAKSRAMGVVGNGCRECRGVGGCQCSPRLNPRCSFFSDDLGLFFCQDTR